MNNELNPKSLISIAFYLPQFHATLENNLWWGEGFTEWSQLRAWKPFFKGHTLRRPVAPLGEYNLLNPATLEAQSDLAARNGIDGFAVWNYWFGEGDRLLERPLELVLKNQINFRFCLAWANHSWMNWEKGTLLKQQRYLGSKDYDAYYQNSARHFDSENYIKVDGKPVFIIHNPSAIPDLPVFVERWNTLAQKSGFKGIFFIGERVASDDPICEILDGRANSSGFWSLSKKLPWNFIKEKLRTKLKFTVGGPQRYDYWHMLKDSIPPSPHAKFVPTVFTGWDTTPRHGRRGMVFDNFTEQSFSMHLQDLAAFIKRREEERTIVLIKSWNEWAEGNLLEPDNIFGMKLLEQYRQFASQFQRCSVQEPLSSSA